MIEHIQEQLLNNDLLTGGAILGSAGLLIRWIVPQLHRFLWWLRNRFIISVAVTDEFKQFKWVSYWIAEHPYCKKAKRVSFDSFVKVISKTKVHDNVDPWSVNTTTKSLQKLSVSLAPGWHLLWDGWHPILVNRVMEKLQMKGGEYDNSSIRHEWHLSVWGSRAYVDGLFERMEQCYKKYTDKGVSTYKPGRYGGSFDPCDQVRKRSLESVLLPTEIKAEIQEDLTYFLQSEKWYHDMDIPWRRGYLLEGCPGSGKTSLIRALASEFDKNLYMIPLADVDDEALVDYFNNATNGFVLLEDIDCVFNQRENETSGASFSGVLNALDGALSLDGRIVFMTTNHPDRLDKALIRPGRVDRQFHFGAAKAREISQLYKRFFPNCKNEKEFGKRVESFKPSMAEVQGYLLIHRDDMRGALRNVEMIEQTRKEQQAYEAKVNEL